MDKDRGEIEVSLQFYSKNNNTGSVLDLATKKKHLSLKDIRHSLGQSTLRDRYTKTSALVFRKQTEIRFETEEKRSVRRRESGLGGSFLVGMTIYRRSV